MHREPPRSPGLDGPDPAAPDPAGSDPAGPAGSSEAELFVQESDGVVAALANHHPDDDPSLLDAPVVEALVGAACTACERPYLVGQQVDPTAGVHIECCDYDDDYDALELLVDGLHLTNADAGEPERRR
jgi:hypothetical protein